MRINIRPDRQVKLLLMTSDSEKVADSSTLTSNGDTGTKRVGFSETVTVAPSPPPTPDTNSFSKIPSEFAHLSHKAPNPKPILGSSSKSTPKKPNAPIGDLRQLTFKEFSVQNNATAMAFHYPVIDRPIAPDRVLVSVQFASLAQFDLHKIQRYTFNLASNNVGFGYDFAGSVTSIGSNVSNFAVGDLVVGMIDPASRKGALATAINVRLGRDILIKVTQEQLQEWDQLPVLLNCDNSRLFAIEESDDRDVPTCVIGSSSKRSKLHKDDHTTSKESSRISEQTPIQLGEKNVSADGLYSSSGAPPDTTWPVAAESTSRSGKVQGDSLVANTAIHGVHPPKRVVPSLDTTGFPVSRTGTNKAKPRYTKPTFERSMDEIPSLAKMVLFASACCRAQQVLRHFPPKSTLNILINGGDTHLGLNILQMLCADSYSESRLSLILVVRHKMLPRMTELVDVLVAYQQNVHVRLVTYDSAVDDLVLPGEKVPINYKARMVFCKQVIEAMLDVSASSDPLESKLDIMIDIVGCMQYFHYDVALEFRDDNVSKAFRCSRKESLLMKILKPKQQGSTLVSCCPFDLPDPTYHVEDWLASKSSTVPWSSSLWGVKFVNSLLSTALPYNYVEEIELRAKREWIEQGWELARSGQLKVWLNGFYDWRGDLKSRIHQLRKDDAKILLEIEKF